MQARLTADQAITGTSNWKVGQLHLQDTKMKACVPMAEAIAKKSFNKL